MVRVRRELANPAGHQLEKRALRAVGARLPDALIQNTGHVVKVVPVAQVPVPSLRRRRGRGFTGFCVGHLKHGSWMLSRDVTLVPVHGGRQASSF